MFLAIGLLLSTQILPMREHGENEAKAILQQIRKKKNKTKPKREAETKHKCQSEELELAIQCLKLFDYDSFDEEDIKKLAIKAKQLKLKKIKKDGNK